MFIISVYLKIDGQVVGLITKLGDSTGCIDVFVFVEVNMYSESL